MVVRSGGGPVGSPQRGTGDEVMTKWHGIAGNWGTIPYCGTKGLKREKNSPFKPFSPPIPNRDEGVDDERDEDVE